MVKLRIFVILLVVCIVCKKGEVKIWVIFFLIKCFVSCCVWIMLLFERWGLYGFLVVLNYLGLIKLIWFLCFVI